MEKGKKFYKYRLGLGLLQWIANNKDIASEDKEAGRHLVKSLRGLESSSGISYTIIQGISKGQRSPEYTTLEAIAEALNTKLSTFIAFCEAIPDAEVAKAIEKDNKSKSKKRSDK
ncbi:hypothetical protein SAMN04488128_10813 [Chitinophaga eiseniae]|uniref:HTH cro/C1-type domain-containing protein n=1 Tax=Chitinophaga eiseniae TaxID=634771 RepID=A0A1T4U1Y6_9BACT|nr:hypothetical protein [Chitinophaga eiseniae]SKA46726.1 hypothetical protein SAMN04488128_10813 [Chitinophaga eiseniae]